MITSPISWLFTGKSMYIFNMFHRKQSFRASSTRWSHGFYQVRSPRQWTSSRFLPTFVAVEQVTPDLQSKAIFVCRWSAGCTLTLGRYPIFGQYVCMVVVSFMSLFRWRSYIYIYIYPRIPKTILKMAFATKTISSSTLMVFRNHAQSRPFTTQCPANNCFLPLTSCALVQP